MNHQNNGPLTRQASNVLSIVAFDINTLFVKLKLGFSNDKLVKGSLSCFKKSVSVNLILFIGGILLLTQFWQKRNKREFESS